MRHKCGRLLVGWAWAHVLFCQGDRKITKWRSESGHWTFESNGAWNERSWGGKFSEKLRFYFFNFSQKNKGGTYFVAKIDLTYCEKNCYSDREKLLKYEAEGRKFANVLRLLKQFIHAVKGQTNFWKQNAFLTFSQIWCIRTIITQIGKNHWDIEICRKS